MTRTDDYGQPIGSALADWRALNKHGDDEAEQKENSSTHRVTYKSLKG